MMEVEPPSFFVDRKYFLQKNMFIHSFPRVTHYKYPGYAQGNAIL